MQGQVTDLRRGLLDRKADACGLLAPAGRNQRGDGRHALAQLSDLAAGRLIFRRLHDRAQGDGVVAPVQRGQGGGGADRLVHDGRVRGGQRVDEGADARQVLVEAGHAQVEHLCRLLAAHVRRLARLLYRPLQRAAYPSSSAAVPASACVAAPCCRSRERLLRASRRAGCPGASPSDSRPPSQLRLLGAPAVGAPTAMPRPAAHAGGERDSAGAAGRIAAERHAAAPPSTGSARPVDATARAAGSGAARPAPRVFAGGRLQAPGDDGGRQLVERFAAERVLAVERLVERDAEAELIGARVGGRAPELLGRHVERACRASSPVRVSAGLRRSRARRSSRPASPASIASSRRSRARGRSP